jgi:hypothetical protein
MRLAPFRREDSLRGSPEKVGRVSIFARAARQGAYMFHGVNIHLTPPAEARVAPRLSKQRERI